MKKTIFGFIRFYSWKQQLILLVITGISLPFLYASLDLPKTIVNKAIDGHNFPALFLGFSLDQIDYLFVLCAIFLILVGINGAFKYFINVYKGLVGERMLRRLRYQLYSRILRFPLPRFRQTSQGELIAMITAEVEPLGGFIGDAVAQPMFQGGTLLTILTFMFVQDVVLGLAAVALYPLQVYVIPKLQRQVNQLGKERVRTVRRLSERIGETVSTVSEIHANDTAERHRADFAAWSGTIFDIRFRIYRKKFFIKFLNNFIAQLTPFFFYSIGGYLVIRGQLSFGALVAVLAAYKDLSSPWKELLDWYQQKEDTRIKYEQLVEQFDAPGLLDDALLATASAEVPHLQGPVIASNLVYEEEGGVRLVDGITFSFELKERVGIIGGSGAGADTVAQLLARLLLPTGGSIHFGDVSAAQLGEAVTGRRIAYVGPEVTLIVGSIRDNLLYPLRRQPLRPATYEGEALRKHLYRQDEAERSGNTTSDPKAEWTDYDAAGVADEAALLSRIIELLDVVDLGEDMFSLGLRQSLKAAEQPELVARILTARRMLGERLRDASLADLVETFDPERYNSNMSVAENILFGTPVGPALAPEQIAANHYMRQVLDQLELTEEMVAIGLSVAKIMIDLFRDIPPGHETFERFSFISSDNLTELQAVVRRVEGLPLADAEEEDRAALLSLPFKLIPARHRLGVCTPELEARFLVARHAFAVGLPADLRGSIAFFDPVTYNDPASVQDNILFGKLAYGRPFAQRRIGALLAEVVEELGLRQDIADLGLGFQVGIGGGRLSAVQRQKVALARALLKRPDLLILDRALDTLDASSLRAVVGRLLAARDHSGLISVMGPGAETDGFDRRIVIEAGRIVEQESMLEQQAGIEHDARAQQ
ncbi:ABC transporter ATP-binding protein/permease [Defluviicoccus vanus]|uniref:ABC transporter ATP-binding protein/permease n=1 Tax=Defluviicoccus vanus TaxID=111831 RepID=UPI001CBA608B|nr:ABC transporter ATP-binding protein/permease [Defluviicoccus vanus]